MKRFLTLSTIALVALSMGIGAKAAPQETRAALERTIQRDTHKIHALQNRRAYLHRYIRHLRNPHVAPARTTTTRSATSSYTGGVLSDAQVTSYLLAAGFPSSAVPTMLYYSHRESGNDPNAINSSSGACGLFQIYPAQPGCTNPAANAAMAYAKYRASGFAPWGG